MFFSVLVATHSVSGGAETIKPPQFVLLAFDGSKNIDFWNASRKFAAESNVKFTYFISGVHFIADSDRKMYTEPKFGKGQSNIGFGGTAEDIVRRLTQVQLAIEEGHEIASHANGHFDGGKFTEQNWANEMDQFRDVMANAWQRYDRSNEPLSWKNYFQSQMLGFRAPILRTTNGLWPVLKTRGYTYDTSRMGPKDYWPKKVDGLWNFPLAQINIAGSRRQTLSMDYNFFMAQSNALPGPATEHKRYEDEMFQSYLNYFNSNYNGNRAPVHIGHHFTLWNGGAYWKAMKRFAQAVCNQPDVKCVTYSELVEYLETNGSR